VCLGQTFLAKVLIYSDLAKNWTKEVGFLRGTPVFFKKLSNIANKGCVPLSQTLLTLANTKILVGIAVFKVCPL